MLLLLALLGPLGWVQAAHAGNDSVAIRIEQLDSDQDYKLRLSAAVWLAKHADPRAIAALTVALADDKERSIRQVAARGLGKLVDGTTPARERKQAIAALERAAKRDKSSRVRRAAKRSLQRLASVRRGLAAAGGAESGRGSTQRPTKKTAHDSGHMRVFLNIGKPRLGKHRVPRGMRTALQRAVIEVLTTQAPEMAHRWSLGKLPTQAELTAQQLRGFFLGASLAKLDVRVSGASAEIRCSVTMQVNPWDGRDGKQRLTAGSTASASGSGVATGDNTRSGIDQAKHDCVLAVAQQVTSTKIVPFLQRLAAADR